MATGELKAAGRSGLLESAVHVFLDTNIFHSHWHLDAALFRALARYINNEGHMLLLSRLVLEEVENLYRRELDTAYQQALKATKELSRLTRSDPLVLPDRASLPKYDLLALVSEQFAKVIVVGYDSLPQSTVTSRALAPRRPFREKDKGYRDTLIWLSLLEHLKQHDPGDGVAFVTNNSSDFLATGGKAFHEDLLEDLRAYGLPGAIVPFTSLAAFVDEKVDKDADALDRTKSISEFSRFLEDEATNFIESGDDAFRRELGQLIVPGSDALSRASPMTASLVEGVEDFEYVATQDLGNDEVYVSCIFDLRMVELVLDIPVHDFHAHSDAILASRLVVEANPNGPIATIRAVVRPVFRASFTFSRKGGDCRGFAVDAWTLVGRSQ